MIPKSLPLPLIILLLTISSTTASPQVSDVSYSELEVTSPPHQSSTVNIISSKQLLHNWQFPDILNVTNLLIKSTITHQLQPQILPTITSIDESISFVKRTISRFAQLSDKAQMLAENIHQLSPIKNDTLLDVTQAEFNTLEEHQARLANINLQINTKGIELQKIMHDMMAQQENPLFKKLTLNFEKKALTQKIALFEQIYSGAKSGKNAADSKVNQNKVNEYFAELDKIFTSQSGLIDEIDTLLKNHNELTILKARVTSLTSQLKAHDLTLSEKQECAREFENIKQKQMHDKEVIKLVETLKQKKMEYNEPNKYCEGVVKKLIERVKKLLIGYDYVFECAQELNEVKANRDKIQRELNEAQKKLDELQLSKGVDTFRENFENNRAVIGMKVQELKKLQLDDFYMYPDTVHSAIVQARERISEIDRTMASIPAKSNENLQQIQEVVKEKVNEIKSLKLSYCKQNDLYTKQTEMIESRLLKLQQQEDYNRWVKELIAEKYEELERVKEEMQNIQAEVEQHLVDQIKV